jgi:hypothetical protein
MQESTLLVVREVKEWLKAVLHASNSTDAVVSHAHNTTLSRVTRVKASKRRIFDSTSDGKTFFYSSEI